MIDRWTMTVAITIAGMTGTVYAQPKPLSLAWEYPTPRVLPQAILRDQTGRDTLYVALKQGGLAILDISNPKLAPKEIATIGTVKLEGLDVMHLTQRKDLLYLALGDFFNANGSHAGLAVVNVAKPREPKVISVWKSKEKLQGAAVVILRDKYAYLGAMRNGVVILDIGDPTKIVKAAEILPDVDFPLKTPNKTQHPNARGFAIKDHYLYVAYDAGGLRTIDIENPLKPREVGRYINGGMGNKQQAYNNLIIDGTVAYAAIDYAGMEVLDIRDPRHVKQLAWWNPWEAQTAKNLWFNSPGHTNQIEYDARQKLVYLSAGDSDLQIVDVSDRTQPKLTGRYGDPKDKLGVWGLTLTSDYVYLAYIEAVIPFQGTWSGIKAIKRK